MTITANQAARIKTDCQKMANEPIELEIVGGVLYAYCSELAALRFANKYPKQVFDGKAKAAFSKNMSTWFFRLEI